MWSELKSITRSEQAALPCPRTACHQVSSEHQLGLWTKSTAKQLLVVTRAEPLLTGCAGLPELHQQPGM